MADVITVDENRREFSRVEARLPLSARLVTAEERPHMRSRIASQGVFTDYSALPDIKDSALKEWLKLIHTKQDTILNALTFEREGFDCLPYRTTAISGNGMNFLSGESFQIDDLIEIRIVLSSNWPSALWLYGKVVKTVPSEGSYLVAVQFVQLDDSVRNEIIRYVFEREREILRKKRG